MPHTVKIMLRALLRLGNSCLGSELLVNKNKELIAKIAKNTTAQIKCIMLLVVKILI